MQIRSEETMRGGEISKTEKGFTPLELLLVLALIAVIVAIARPGLQAFLA